MSAVDGWVFVVYQGARDRRSPMSAGSCPVVAYQQVAMAWQASWNGMGALDGAGLPVAGLAGAEDLFRIFYRNLDGPS